MRIELHAHSTASDGEYSPAEVVRRAAAAGVEVLALTDHDTLGGITEATRTGAELGVRIIPGCEFSVAGPGGEMHLLGYFIPSGDSVVESFLEDQRSKRLARAREMIRRLQHSGVAVTEERVSAIVGTGAWGRPHVARAMVSIGVVKDTQEAFDRFIGFGKPAFVGKVLPAVAAVTALVRSAGGITAAAHLKDRGVRPVLRSLREAGVDAVEVMHPAHDESTVRRLGLLAAELGMLTTGGSDWHGEQAADRPHGALGSQAIPREWLGALEQLHRSRRRKETSQ